MFRTPSNAAIDVDAFCGLLNGTVHKEGIECVPDLKKGGFVYSTGSAGVGLQLVIHNNAKHFAVFKNCDAPDGGTQTVCLPQNFVAPESEPIIRVFWKKPFMEPLLAMEAAVTQRFGIDAFTKEMLRASRLASFGLVPPVYELYTDLQRMTRHPLLQTAYCMGFVKGAVVSSMRRWNYREARNVSANARQEFLRLIRTAKTGILTDNLQEKLVDSINKSNDILWNLLRESLIFLRTSWFFAGRFWHRGMLHCDFHGGNLMSPSVEYDLSNATSVARLDDLSSLGYVLVRPQKGSPVWDSSQHRFAPYEKHDIANFETFVVDTASVVYASWKAIDPATGLDLRHILDKGVPMKSLVNPCGFYRGLSVEDVNHMLTAMEKTLEAISMFKRMETPLNTFLKDLTDLCRAEASQDPSAKLILGLQQGLAHMAELGAILQLEQWTRRALQFDFSRRCRQQAHERYRWALSLQDFPSVLRRRANKDLFISSKIMPKCTFEDYLWIKHIVLGFLEEEILKLERSQVGKRMIAQGIQVQSTSEKFGDISNPSLYHANYAQMNFLPSKW